MPTIATESITVEGVELSYRSRRPYGAIRGVLFALHGGTYDSSYYDNEAISLLDLASARGYLVILIDRPGYGASHGADPAVETFDAQARILASALVTLWTERGEGMPVVLIGHSIGGMLALLVASLHPQVPLRGVAVSALGALWQPGLLEMWSSLISDDAEVSVPPEAHNGVMYGPAETFDADQQARLGDLLKPMSMPELRDVVQWSDRLPSVGASVDVPVQATLSQYDNIWQSDDAARAALKSGLTGGPSVEVKGFADVGHSAELHHDGEAFLSAQLDFADRVIAG